MSLGPGALWRGGISAEDFRDRELLHFDSDSLKRYYGRLIAEAKTPDEQIANRAELERRLKAIAS